MSEDQAGTHSQGLEPDWRQRRKPTVGWHRKLQVQTGAGGQCLSAAQQSSACAMGDVVTLAPLPSLPGAAVG